jgi:hypothetical protein
MRVNVDAAMDLLSSDFRLCSCGWLAAGRPSLIECNVTEMK